MRKIVIIFIALIVCASLFACVRPAKNVGETIDDALNGETVTATIPEEPSATEATKDNTIPFEYKMAEIKPSLITETKTKYFYVLEFLHNEHSAATFIPICNDEKTLTEKYPNSTVEIYNGHICNEDFVSHTENDVSLSNYRELITLVITIDSTAPVNEVFAIKSSIMHRETGAIEDVAMFTNSKIEDITTPQNIVYGKTLVNLDNDYYVFYRNGTGTNENPIARYTSYSLIPIGKENTPLSEKLNKNTTFVSSKNEKVELPEDYDIYFIVNENGYDIGIKSKIDVTKEESKNESNSTDETEVKIEIDEELMKNEIFLKYKDQNGKEINFVANIKKAVDK